MSLVIFLNSLKSLTYAGRCQHRPHPSCSSGCQWHRKSQSWVLRDSAFKVLTLLQHFSPNPSLSLSPNTVFISWTHMKWLSFLFRGTCAWPAYTFSLSHRVLHRRKPYCALNAIRALNTPNSWNKRNIISMLWNQPSELTSCIYL